MCKNSLRRYDYFPQEMRAYYRNYGWSFSKRACEYAVSQMARRSKATDKAEKIEPWSKEKVEELLAKYNIKLEHNSNYNFVYVCNKAIADCYNSSVPDEAHLAMHIKDVIDDIDGCTDSIFNCWVTTQEDKGISIPWEDLI